MGNWLLEHYLWLKALHIISVIAWMAGMLYLPRLFAYHAGTDKGSHASETFKVMERRLLRIIINPAMMAAFVFGGLMIWANPALMGGGWFHAKAVLIILMTACHGLFARWRKDFLKDQNVRPARFYRIWNEVPTVLMIFIVIMAVVKPF
ncbi:MAG: protoporphyrinogen oxidase HemJ [Micavibrio aeruginosavorus]|uniref:Protoporphyrinogen IX oxidase n=1 Tax=Micavibrio aeruginosavorus TaxID=349221 RepID=A0A7T5R2L7_9BACT|nr:MAG: protoporphyrinogen oxidase HemJ [Micavibrio aeruginosavorus]